MKNVALIFLTILFLNFLTVNGQFPTNSFADKIDFATGSSIQGIQSGDLNGDRKPEIVTANLGTSNIIEIFLNNTTLGGINSSSFSTKFSLTTLSANPLNVKLADINNDGRQDIIVVYNSSTNNLFSIFFNNYISGVFSSASFSRLDYFSGGTFPSGIAIGDFDLDGKQDIAISNYASNNIAVFRNVSTTSNFILASAITFSTGNGPSSIASGDINNDGKADIVTSNWLGNSITVLRNTNSVIGTINLTSISSGNSISTQTNPNWVNICDFNFNGLMEVVVSNWQSNSTSIFENTSTTTISFSTRVDISASPFGNPQVNKLVDSDDDGKIDLIQCVASSPIVYLLKNIHSTGLVSSSSFSSKTSFGAGSTPVGLDVVDLDLDFRPDLIVGNASGQSISVLKNRIITSEPTFPSSNLQITNSLAGTLVQFTKGNGAKRLVVIRSSSSINQLPIDSQWYSPNDTFSKGSNIGSNNFVVYNDTGNQFLIKDLPQGQSFIINIFEHNGRGGFSNYLTSQFLTGTIFLGNAYYSKSTGNLNDTATWGPNIDGSGPSPSNFNSPNTFYNIRNNSNPTISGNWIVLGSNSSIFAGDGSTAINLLIPSGFSIFTDSIFFSRNATVTIQGGIVVNKARFDSLSTAQFTLGNQNIPPFNYYNLVLIGGTKTLLGNTTVRGTLGMVANINTSSSLLTLGTSSTNPGQLSRSSGMISGRFGRWFSAATNGASSGLLPLGFESNYRPVTIEFTSAPTLGGLVVAEFINTNPGNAGLPLYDFSTSPLVEVNKASKNGFWKLDNQGIVGGVFTVTMQGTGFHGISNVGELRVIRRATAGAWTLPGSAISGSGTVSAPVCSRTGQSLFGEFTIGGDSSSNSLPVTWGAISGEKTMEGAVIYWETHSEFNNSHFEVLKLEEGGVMQIIAKMKANNSLISSKYSYIDKTFIKSGLYQIRQVDFDGQSTLSKTLFIEENSNNDDLPSFSPNPAKDGYIDFFSNLKFNRLILIDLSGREFELEVIDGRCDVSRLSRGIYMLKIENSNAFSEKLVIL
ncbi:MAG: VCBS repeat-containing protein [Bacteroidetes bacterium]|nr:VCBS repeat-containing protein [Bacteroidota bacterium]